MPTLPLSCLVPPAGMGSSPGPCGSLQGFGFSGEKSGSGESRRPPPPAWVPGSVLPVPGAAAPGVLPGSGQARGVRRHLTRRAFLGGCLWVAQGGAVLHPLLCAALPFPRASDGCWGWLGGSPPGPSLLGGVMGMWGAGSCPVACPGGSQVFLAPLLQPGVAAGRSPPSPGSVRAGGAQGWAGLPGKHLTPRPLRSLGGGSPAQHHPASGRSGGPGRAAIPRGAPASPRGAPGGFVRARESPLAHPEPAWGWEASSSRRSARRPRWAPVGGGLRGVPGLVGGYPSPLLSPQRATSRGWPGAAGRRRTAGAAPATPRRATATSAAPRTPAANRGATASPGPAGSCPPRPRGEEGAVRGFPSPGTRRDAALVPGNGACIFHTVNSSPLALPGWIPPGVFGLPAWAARGWAGRVCGVWGGPWVPACRRVLGSPGGSRAPLNCLPEQGGR